MRIPQLPAVVAGLLILGLMGCGEPSMAVDPWRSSDQALADRVEQLAGAGEVDAAQGVFTALTARPGLVGAPPEQRARLAMARALVTSGRHDDALIHVRGISWADKGPQIAAQVLSLESRLRWQQLTAEGRVLSGALPPRAAADAPQGAPGGRWLERREAYRAFAEILDRGQRSVRGEGHELMLPASAPEIAIARFACGN